MRIWLLGIGFDINANTYIRIIWQIWTKTSLIKNKKQIKNPCKTSDSQIFSREKHEKIMNSQIFAEKMNPIKTLLFWPYKKMTNLSKWYI